MNSKSKLAAIAIIAAVGVGMPAVAFAQLQTGTAANREQLYGYGSAPSQFVPYYGRQAGLGAHAEVPRSAFVTRARPGGHFRRQHQAY
jgi:hypothetical protein